MADADTFQVRREQIAALTAFRSVMEGRVAGTWAGGEQNPDGSRTMPYFDYSPEILAFMRACGENGWIEVFDWGAWQPEALRYHESPDRLGGASVEDIRKLLTLHIRKDRFSEGHFAAMVESGHIAAILRRLAEISNG
ncbi:MAG: DUF6508 domain-containing protein [Dehalococcoidia bacterium]